MLWFGECHFGFIPALEREAFSLYFRNPTTARFLYHAPSSHGSGITPTETAPTSETVPRSTSALVGTSGMPEVPTRALVLLGTVSLVGAVSVGVIPEP